MAVPATSMTQTRFQAHPAMPIAQLLVPMRSSLSTKLGQTTEESARRSMKRSTVWPSYPPTLTEVGPIESATTSSDSSALMISSTGLSGRWSPIWT